MTGPWVCSSCSTTNAAGDQHCAVCDGPRPTTGQTPTGASTPVVPVVPPPGPPPSAPSPNLIRTGGMALPPSDAMPPSSTGFPPPGATAQPFGAAPAPTGAPAPGEPTGPPSRTRLALLAVVFALLAVGVGVGAFLLVSGSKKSDRTTTRTADAESGATRDPVRPEPAPTSAPPRTVAETTTTEPELTTRSGQTWGDTSKLRTAPRLDAGEIAYRGGKGTPLTVFGTAEDGWYEVEVDGKRGYMYAGLVVPPDPGFCVVSGPGYWVDRFGSAMLYVHDETDEDGWTLVVAPDRETFESLTDAKERRCS